MKNKSIKERLEEADHINPVILEKAVTEYNRKIDEAMNNMMVKKRKSDFKLNIVPS